MFFVTARSCFSERCAENQGLWELERGFLYRIYTRKLRIWGCDMAGYFDEVVVHLFQRRIYEKNIYKSKEYN